MRESDRRIELSWMRTPWDEAIFNYPVITITELKTKYFNESVLALNDFIKFQQKEKCQLISCRLPSKKVLEGMALEAAGFKFIEMTISPRLNNLQKLVFSDSSEIKAIEANQEDLSELSEIAKKIFTNERFHIDPRIDSNKANLRYANWIRTSYNHDTQKIYCLRDEKASICAFFITEIKNDGTMYWHLNGVSPEKQGKGWGHRCWLAMMQEGQRVGATAVQSNIAVRNYKVMNLYAKLGYHFLPPEMTFHWVGSNNSQQGNSDENTFQ